MLTMFAGQIPPLGTRLATFKAQPQTPMKMKLISTSKLALLCTAVCATMLAFSNNASALTIGDGHELGFVNFGIPSSEQDRVNYVNHLIGMGLGTSDSAFGQTFFRSNNSFGPLPTAVIVGPTVTFQNPPSVVSINIGTGLYTYLFAKYDGPNFGSEVWYIGDLSGTITIPGFAGRYGLSGYTLFGPGTPGVPDGGTTAMLLGMGFGALGMARRFLKR
jgi:VPDSG-CTERM motif